MFNSGQNFDAWKMQNQIGLANNQGQNEWNMDQNNNQNSQQALWASIMGGMF